MDELVNLVAQKAGISHDQAATAVQTVYGFLKERLPAPVASQLDSLIAGQGTGQQGGNPLGKIFGA